MPHPNVRTVVFPSHACQQLHRHRRYPCRCCPPSHPCFDCCCCSCSIRAFSTHSFELLSLFVLAFPPLPRRLLASTLVPSHGPTSFLFFFLLTLEGSPASLHTHVPTHLTRGTYGVQLSFPRRPRVLQDQTGTEMWRGVAPARQKSRPQRPTKHPCTAVLMRSVGRLQA